MKRLILRWFVSAISIYVIASLFSGISLTGFSPALIAALILGVINTFIRPLLFFFTLPINILTLGLFTFVINGLVLKITSILVVGFYVRGVWIAIIGAIFISIVNMLIGSVVGVKED